MAASAVDLANHGFPTSFGDLAHFAMQQGEGIIPGVGPMLQQTQAPQAWPSMPGQAAW